MLSSVRFRRERSGAAKQIQLAPPRFHEVAAQVAVGRVAGERFPRLVDGLVDDLQVVFDDGDGGSVETAASGLQRFFEVGDSGVVLRVRHAHVVDAGEVGGAGALEAGRSKRPGNRASAPAFVSALYRRRQSEGAAIRPVSEAILQATPPETAISSAAAAASCGSVNAKRLLPRRENGTRLPRAGTTGASMRAATPAHRSACGGRAVADAGAGDHALQIVEHRRA